MVMPTIMLNLFTWILEMTTILCKSLGTLVDELGWHIGLRHLIGLRLPHKMIPVKIRKMPTISLLTLYMALRRLCLNSLKLIVGLALAV